MNPKMFNLNEEVVKSAEKRNYVMVDGEGNIIILSLSKEEINTLASFFDILIDHDFCGDFRDMKVYDMAEFKGEEL